MNLSERKTWLIRLGQLASFIGKNSAWNGYSMGITENEHAQINQLIHTVHQHNGWFTEENVRLALAAWGEALSTENLERWLKKYDLADMPVKQKTVLIICAGNIPLVALHDILTVFLSGNIALVKLSKDDDLLIPALVELLVEMDTRLTERIVFTATKPEHFDAVIATGSDNSARYFEYYFGKYPHIIRRNRNSVAVLSGAETAADLKNLGHDVFDYFGLGCRSVSKIYIPRGYELDVFFKGIYDFNPVINHNKYANNYDYNKAIWLLNQDSMLDNGFILLKEESAISSPTGSLYYEYYDDREMLQKNLTERAEQLQCTVDGKQIAFGQSQCPMLWDYADGVDNMQFTIQLSRDIIAG